MKKMSAMEAMMAVLLFGGYVIHAADADKDPVVAKYKAKLEYAKKQYLAAVDKIKQAMAKDYKRLRDAAMARKDLDLANKYQAKINALTAKDAQGNGEAAAPDADKDKSQVDLDVGIPADPDALPAGEWKSLDNCDIADENGITRFSQDKKGNPGKAYIPKDLGNSYTISGSFRAPKGEHFSIGVFNLEKQEFVLCNPTKTGDMLLAQLKKGDGKKREKLAFVKFDWGDMGEWRDFTLVKRRDRLTLTVGKAKATIKLKDYRRPFFGFVVYSRSVLEIKNLKVSK